VWKDRVRLPAGLLRFKSNPFLRLRNARLVDQNEPANKAILICGLLFDFRDEETRNVFHSGSNSSN
jgi:hypothetical protein